MTYQSPFDELKANLAKIKAESNDSTYTLDSFVQAYEEESDRAVEEFNAFLAAKRRARGERHDPIAL